MAKCLILFFCFVFSVTNSWSQEPGQPFPPGKPNKKIKRLPFLEPGSSKKPERQWENELKGHPPMFQNEPETVPAPGPSDSLNGEEDLRLAEGIYRKMDGYFFSLSYGWQKSDLSSLNQVLELYNYPKFKQYSISNGIVGYRLLAKWLIGAEGHYSIYGDNPNPFYNAKLFNSLVLAQGGYRIISSSSILLYPLVGIGGARSTLKISEKQMNSINFNQFLSNPNKNLDIETGNFILALSLNLNYFTKEVTLHGFHFGISAGYIFALPNSDWYTFNNNLDEGPNLNIGGPFLRLRFGGGHFTLP